MTPQLKISAWPAKDQEPIAIEPLLDYKEVCRILGIKKSKFYDLANSGELPTVQVGRYKRVHPKDLQAWIEKQRSGI